MRSRMLLIISLFSAMFGVGLVSAYGVTFTINGTPASVFNQGQLVTVNLSLPNNMAYNFSYANFSVNGQQIFVQNFTVLSSSLSPLGPCIYAAIANSTNSSSCGATFSIPGSYSGSLTFTNDTNPTNTSAEATVLIEPFMVNPELAISFSLSGGVYRWPTNSHCHTLKCESHKSFKSVNHLDFTGP